MTTQWITIVSESLAIRGNVINHPRDLSPSHLFLFFCCKFMPVCIFLLNYSSQEFSHHAWSGESLSQEYSENIIDTKMLIKRIFTEKEFNMNARSNHHKSSFAKKVGDALHGLWRIVQQRWSWTHFIRGTRGDVYIRNRIEGKLIYETVREDVQLHMF